MLKALPLLLVVLLSACRPPPSGTWSGEALNCATDVVRQCGPEILPSVNTCLANGTDGWRGCLINLIGPGACTAETVVGCAVRQAGSSAAASAQANQHDEVSARMADRARTWVSERGYRFP